MLTVFKTDIDKGNYKRKNNHGTPPCVISTSDQP